MQLRLLPLLLLLLLLSCPSLTSLPSRSSAFVPSPVVHALRRWDSACSLQPQAVEDREVITATRLWIDGWVVGLSLCPWAWLVRKPPELNLSVIRSEAMERDVKSVVMAARELVEVHSQISRDDGRRGFATTLLMFPSEKYAGTDPYTLANPSDAADPSAICGDFPVILSLHIYMTCILQSSEEADCCGGGNDMITHLVGTGQEALAEMPVDLLAFHRYPTLQLLVKDDLKFARRQWAAWQRRKKAEELSTLGLLFANKDKLRAIGRGFDALARQMREFLSSRANSSARLEH
ncbi:hypothetical protein GUITHDRAFT_133844 [Guillardia theta CCMP2712]|uniref:Uncharacterized protein n=1 Tax=Guillardia theta (strain CCMP2712) TaxID=905079 RepID=L1JUV6_GUITC|nr:hypothetical protein GUITHDRAFT_133844 [Guillardia theta CCMP2712]EKX52109.1 hypothetical protein GUITHDRAFT_133844 [Guillardia theta CCMP2712]|eukprot:XP_005839089.1 hypothetical protein GUITHDRAFT_133844 [Guillardia theta CCMP2712]